MLPVLPRRITGTSAALAAAMSLAACTAALGPGFRIERQELSAEYVAGAQPALRVRAVWRVQNMGNQPLDGVEASLPDAQSHDLRNVRAEWNGAALATARAAGRGVRIPFDPPLAMGDSGEIALSYELRGAKSDSAGADVTDLGFVLPSGDWAPALLRPRRAFSRGGEPPKKWEMNFRVPAGWHVYASGKAKGVERRREVQPESAIHHFAQRREDTAPFAVGGAFQEQKVAAGGNEVILWTRQPLPADMARRYAEAAVSTAQFYDGAFGPRKNAARELRIIECPRKDPCWAVPAAALLGGAIQREDSWSAVCVELEQQLAYTWLDFQVHPSWESEPLPMGALADYATELATAAREGEDARWKIIHALVVSFDYSKARLPEPPILNVQLSDPVSARQFAGVKCELFFFALEDAAGRENLWAALRHLMKTYHGGTWRADDLRSALEQESGKGWGPLFHKWLVDPGIPEEFRSRY